MYVDGFVAAVPKDKKQDFIKHVEEAAQLVKEFGVTRVVETWQDDVSPGQVTDFFGAVKAKENEQIVFSWFEWPSKEVRDEGVKKMMADERMKNMEMPFDASRVIYGGFQPVLDKKF